MAVRVVGRGAKAPLSGAPISGADLASLPGESWVLVPGPGPLCTGVSRDLCICDQVLVQGCHWRENLHIGPTKQHIISRHCLGYTLGKLHRCGWTQNLSLYHLFEIFRLISINICSKNARFCTIHFIFLTKYTYDNQKCHSAIGEGAQ